MISNKQKGLTFIEVLIAWAMVAIFLSSAMWAQIEFLQKSRVEREKMIAQWQLEDMAERLMANKNPTSEDRELERWNQENQKLFREPKARLSCRKNICEISLMWGRGGHLELRV